MISSDDGTFEFILLFIGFKFETDVGINAFQVSTPFMFHEIGKIDKGIVPHRIPVRDKCLTPCETDPWS